MISDVIEEILEALEYKFMYEAAAEVCKIAKVDENIIKYYKLLSGENIEIDATHLDKRRKENYDKIVESHRDKEISGMMIAIGEDSEIKKMFQTGLTYFNNENYKEAEKYFKDIIKNLNEEYKALALTYLSLCQYKMDESVDALRTINQAIDIRAWDKNLKRIRDGIIDKIAGMENKNRFIEDYYFKGTYVGEVLRHSLELYEKIDNIEISNKNLLKKIPQFFSEAKRIFNDEKKKLQNDLVNIDTLVSDAENKLKYYLNDEEAKRFANNISRLNLPEDIEKVLRGAEILFITRNKESNVDYSYIAFSYFKAVEMLARDKILPYFQKYRPDMPVLEDQKDYAKIGIKSIDAGGIVRYTLVNDFKIDSSHYLVEINKHSMLRKDFKGKEHNMPWDKLKFISYSIKTGKDPIDGSKSAGMIMLFYCAYRNYLHLDFNAENKEDIIVLAGDLIRLQNERNSLMHSKVLNDNLWIESIRNLSLKNIDGLLKIK